MARPTDPRQHTDCLWSNQNCRVGLIAQDYGLVFEFPKIKYKYTYQKSDNQGLSQEGFGEIQFIERNGPPVKYLGFSFNLMEGRRVTFHSWKVDSKETLALLDDPASDKKAILDFLKSKLVEFPEQAA